MKRLISRYALFTLLVFFSSCSFVKNITIDIVESPKVFLPANFKQIALINAASYVNLVDDNSLNYKKALLDSLAADECIYGIIEAYEKSIFYSEETIPIIKIKKNDTTFNRELFNWKLLEDICIKTNSDLVVSLEYYVTRGEFILDNTVLRSYPNIKFRIYDPVERKLIDQYVYTDTLLFDLYTEENTLKFSTEEQLVKNYILESGYWAGLDYGERIFPYWQSVNRFYYIGEYPEFKRAELYMVNSEYNYAAEEWIKMVNFPDKVTASNAAFNVAVAFELLDNLDVALEWAEKSNAIHKSKAAKNYITILKARKADVNKLKDNRYLSK